MQQRDLAYVLHTSSIGDADVLVSLVTQRHGQVRGVARHARRSQRRFGGALEPMTRVRAVWSERQGRELHRLESMEAERSFAALQSEPLQLGLCAVLSEITRALTREGESDERGFRLLGAVLEALDGGGDPWTLLRYFEYWTLRVHGLLPLLDCCAACGRDLGPGQALRASPRRGILCGGCPAEPHEGVLRVQPAERRFLVDVVQGAPHELAPAGEVVGPGGALDRLLRGALETYAERSFRAYRHLGFRLGSAGEDSR